MSAHSAQSKSAAFCRRPCLAAAFLTSITLFCGDYSAQAEEQSIKTAAAARKKQPAQAANKQAEAELEAADSADMLREIVMTATGFEQTLRDAPASISTVSREQLEKGAFHDITDALRPMQGVSVTGAAGKEDIYIRGLPGAYTLILVDGKRQSTREARTNGSSGFEQSFIPPAAAIERVEVVRGPMSSLYGSDAMGGVINIITRKVPQKWTGSITADGTANQHSRYGDTGQGSYYLAGPIAPDILGLQIWGRGLRRGEDKIIDGTPKKKEGDFTGKLTFTPTDNQEFNAEIGRTKLRRYNHVGKVIDSGTNNNRAAVNTYNSNSRDHWSAGWTGRFAKTTAEFSFLQEEARRRDYNWNAERDRYITNLRSPQIRNRVADGKFTTPFSLFGSHMLVTGGQWTQGRLHDTNPGMRDNKTRAFAIEQWALFGEDEWRLNDAFALTGGLRFDHHEIYGENWSPRGYAVWHATDKLTFKTGVSTGFRAPEIRDIAPGYAYTTGGGNCYYGRNPPKGRNRCAVIISDDNLKPEKSTSYEFSALWDDLDKVQLSATGFYTDFKDKLADRQVFGPDGRQLEWAVDPNYVVNKNMNIDRSHIHGAELTASWQALESLALKANYTYTKSEQKTGDYKGLPLARTPKNMANLRADWQTPMEKLSAWTAANYHGKEINAGFRVGSHGKPVYRKGKIVGREYDDYLTVDIGATYAFTDKVKLNAAIYNLADKRIGVGRYNDVIEGRRIWASLTAGF